ncbi:hypothetical protein [Polaromonas sp.]|uniref:hypothetical protein n=1 Tax=Polaromonas sp. TaxID=1869339 RepID=UPI0025DA74EC|nr:hypothetical protein [Polaromonas sp.]
MTALMFFAIADHPGGRDTKKKNAAPSRTNPLHTCEHVSMKTWTSMHPEIEGVDVPFIGL